jgi:hypothetical protein
MGKLDVAVARRRSSKRQLPTEAVSQDCPISHSLTSKPGRGTADSFGEGGLNSKLHAVCEDLGRPLVLLLSEAQMSDYKGAALMIDALVGRGIAALRPIITRRGDRCIQPNLHIRHAGLPQLMRVLICGVSDRVASLGQDHTACGKIPPRQSLESESEGPGDRPRNIIDAVLDERRPQIAGLVVVEDVRRIHSD